MTFCFLRQLSTPFNFFQRVGTTNACRVPQRVFLAELKEWNSEALCATRLRRL